VEDAGDEAGTGPEGSTSMLISVIIRIVLRLLRSSQDPAGRPVRQRRRR
jgi:hypothetical protein